MMLKSRAQCTFRFDYKRKLAWTDVAWRSNITITYDTGECFWRSVGACGTRLKGMSSLPFWMKYQILEYHRLTILIWRPFKGFFRLRLPLIKPRVFSSLASLSIVKTISAMHLSADRFINFTMAGKATGSFSEVSLAEITSVKCYLHSMHSKEWLQWYFQLSHDNAISCTKHRTGFLLQCASWHCCLNVLLDWL